MTIVDLTDLPGRLAPGKRLLGLDLGRKRIGVAISDSGLRVASPLTVIARRRFAEDAAVLATLIAEQSVGALVLGLPVNMDGSEGPRCQSTRAFARNLLEKGEFNLPISFFDERLSTQAVERLLIDEADMSRRRRAEVVDKMAAAYILQGALDRLSSEAAP